MGFERMDRVARELQARLGRGARGANGGSRRGETPGERGGRASRPGGTPSTRTPRTGSAPRRWMALALLPAVGVAGAAFYVMGSPAPKPPVPVPRPQPAAAAGPAPAAPPSSSLASSGAGLAEAPLPPDPALAEAPVPPIAISVDASPRAAQIAVVLDDLDATLHAVRLDWPGRPGARWRWPRWAPIEDVDRELASLASQLAGADDPVSSAARRWIEVARPGATRLHALVAAWEEPGASADALTAELVPLFAELVAASAPVHAAVTAALPPPPAGSLAALAAGCRVAPLLARLPPRGPAAASSPATERGGAPRPRAAAMPEVPAAELRARADACLAATRGFLDAHADLTSNDVYALRLGADLAVAVLDELQRRQRARRPDQPYAGNASHLAQLSHYLAHTRRRDDPTLRQAEAPPPP